MEMGHHHHLPLLQLPFERKVPLLKTEASSRLCFQKLVSSHEAVTERQLYNKENSSTSLNK